MIQFDEYGYVVPYNVVETDLETLEKVFVTNEHRKELFSQYLEYLERLKEMELGSFFQWVDGSFIGRSKEHPRDIDLVSFIDYERHETNKKRLIALRGLYPKLDCYVGSIFPEEHELHSNYKTDRVYWLHQFTKTRLNRHTKKSFDKGIVQLNF